MNFQALTLGTAIPAWQAFAAIGITLMIAEIFVSGFVLLPIGVAFLLTALASLLVHQWPLLLAILAAFQVSMFWVFQRYLKKFHAKTRAYTNAEGMIGAECSVIEEITPGGFGYVKLYGDEWRAKSMTGASLKKGQRVVIAKIEGNKVLVEPIH